MKVRSVAAGAVTGEQRVVELEILPPQLTTGPSSEEIQRRAYELYTERGCIDGYDQEDWFEAERDLKLAYQQSPLT